MMNEKTMVSDALTGINGELKMYAEYISQSEDPQLKQTLKQMRNKAETAQEQRPHRSSYIRLPGKNLIMFRRKRHQKKRLIM